MELVWILRVLYRRRVAVIAGAVVALVIALAGAYRVSLFPPSLGDRVQSSGYARETVLVNTPNSLVGAARPNGNASVVIKASLLGAALATDEARAAIAKAIGRPVGELEVTTTAEAVPQVPDYLSLAALKAAVHPAPYSVKISQGNGLPILSIAAGAPTPAEAQRLATASTAALTLVSHQVLARGRGVKLETVGAPTVEAKSTVEGKAKPIAIAVFLWLAWCIVVLFYDRLSRRSKRLGAARRPAARPLRGSV
jgi:hypothetical protein